MTRYFSKLTLTKAGIENRVRSSSSGGYQLHKEMWGLFPDNPNGVRNFLYCVIDDGRTVYMLSEQSPCGNDYWIVETKIYDPQVNEGEIFGFRLCANPTKANSKTGKHQRHDVVMDFKKTLKDAGKEVDMGKVVYDSVSQWIIRKGILNGFNVDSSSLKIYGYNRSEFTKGDKTIVISTVIIEGVLRVTDVEKFRASLMNGIGSAKGFGVAC